jgi:hypothetical protein
VPLSVAVRLNGQVVGTLGVKTSVSADPLMLPVPDPLLLFAEFANLVDHVPERVFEDCARENAIVPFPAMALEIVPDQLPAALTEGVVEDVPEHPSTAAAPAIQKTLLIARS